MKLLESNALAFVMVGNQNALSTPSRILYLAVPEDTYEAYFKLLFTQSILESYQVKFLVYNSEAEVIVKWKT